MIRAFRILSGTIKQYVILFAVAVGVTALLGLVKMFAVSEFVTGFIEGFIQLFSIISVTVSGMIASVGVFGANFPSAAGYKYYHSLPLSGELFRKALFFSDIIAIVSMALYSAVGALFFGMEFALFAMGVGAFCVGLMNFFGHSRSPFTKMIPFVVAGGFGGGFFVGLSEKDEFSFSPLLIAMLVTAAVAVCVSGIAFAVLRAKKAWEREG